MVVLLVLGGCSLFAPEQLLKNSADIPADFPGDGFSHDVFESLLQTYVDASGNVDYETWHSSGVDVHALDTYLAAVSRYSPEVTPTRFPSRNDRLAYWLYSYNAYVIKSVLARWPLESVNDVRAPIELARGFGFFYTQKFRFGEKSYSLYAVENKKIRADYKDARIHFVLNCGSESCPVLRPELPTGDDLEPFLDKATMEFVTQSSNVDIDHDNMQLVLNEIFKWFRKDFINDLRQRGLPTNSGIVGYLASIAPASLQRDLARAAEYEVVYRDYDWSVNESL